MSWIILEGLDRTGKTSVAELYKQRGYHIYHFNAPDKKYLEPGYVGPSYFEEIMELYVQLSGQDIVFDRSIYGELVWPKVYNRTPLLDEEEIQELMEMENQNLCQHIVMYDKNVKAHWQRCVANNEPLEQPQFNLARKLFFEVADKYGFGKKTIQDFGIHPGQLVGGDEGAGETQEIGQADNAANNDTSTQNIQQKANGKNSGQDSADRDAKARLEKANAINKVLSSKIINKRGEVYQGVEDEIRSFLEDRMAQLLGSEPSGFTAEEVQVLKLYVKRLKTLEEEKRK